MTMRKTILTALAVLAMGGTATGIMMAQAQPVPPPAAPGAPPPPDGPRFMGWMHRMHERQDGRGPMNPRTFALVYQQQDRNLTPADVQKIAEAFLLWRGNHTWKVVNVAASDGTIGFSLATQDGSVVASFTMDPHTGRITRTG
jgi:hypothetical protein